MQMTISSDTIILLCSVASVVLSSILLHRTKVNLTNINGIARGIEEHHRLVIEAIKPQPTIVKQEEGETE